jgi:1,4-dihydroxy-2-naphthoate octaprenyltransferase
MSRPDQLLLMVLVYAMGIGAALAWGGSVDPVTTLLGFAVYLPLAASVHYANEYADSETDRLTTRTRFSGGSGALVDTGLTQSLPKHATMATAGLAALTITAGVGAGVLTPSSTGLLVVIGLFGWGYSLEPVALAWRGWGEVDNAALGGIALPVYGTSIVTGSVSLSVVAAFLPFGAAVFCNLLATTWPDREADAAVGKNTLATQWSTGRLRRLYGAGLTAVVATTLLGSLTVLPAAVVVVTLLTIPGFGWGWHRYTRQESPFPTVGAMVALAVGQTAAWWDVVYGIV